MFKITITLEGGSSFYAEADGEGQPSDVLVALFSKFIASVGVESATINAIADDIDATTDRLESAVAATTPPNNT